MFNSFVETSIIKNAIAKKIVKIEIINFRDFAIDKHKKVDDVIYGGSPGMLLMLDPIVKCLKKIKNKTSKVFLLSPEGITFNQEMALNLSQNIKHLILIAGHYEGFDYRIHNYVDGIISIGDYILTGGEIPAMLVADAIIRLLPNAINSNSLIQESFNNYLLDYPSYTKPAKYDSYEVPSILLSGNHQKIKKFNSEEQIRITKEKRPDLYKKYLKFKKGSNNE